MSVRWAVFSATTLMYGSTNSACFHSCRKDQQPEIDLFQALHARTGQGLPLLLSPRATQQELQLVRSEAATACACRSEGVADMPARMMVTANWPP